MVFLVGASLLAWSMKPSRFVGEINDLLAGHLKRFAGRPSPTIEAK